MSWISGPCNDEPERDEEQEKPEPRPLLEDTGTHWHRRMARSSSHWVELNYGHFEDAE